MGVPQIPQTTVLSYKLFVRAQDSQMVPLGQVLNIDITERRDVTPNFVIGNDPRDEASNLIPGVVRDRTIRLRRVRLFAAGLRQAFGRDDQTIVASLTDQSTPLDLVATIEDPNTEQTKTITFKDGFLSEVTSALTMEGDIREIESATYVFRSVEETEFQ
jgi:hypothetical protein